MTAAARARMRVRVPLLSVSAAAWLVLVVKPHEAAVCMMPSMRWTPMTLFAASALMFASMMLPLIGAPLLHVRERSFAERRTRAMALFIASYGLFWLVAGAVLLLVSAWISPWLLAIAIAVWQCSPWKQRALNRSHAHTELAAFGVKADLDALRFGFVHAMWCASSCWALMLLPMLFTSGHLFVMAGVTLWLVGERLERPAEPSWRWRGPMAIVRIAAGQTRSFMQPYGPVASRARM